MSLQHQIKKNRKKNKITQGELAQMLGKTKNVISNWERGDNKPDAETILSLCRILGTDPNGLLDWQDKTVSDEEKELILKYRSLNDWQQALVDDMIDKLRDHAQMPAEARKFLSIPFYQLSPAAGLGNYLSEDMEEEKIDLLDTPENRKIDYVLRVDGRSMEPKFHDGDLVKIVSQQSIHIGEIGIFIVDGNSFIKEYRANGLHSLNPEYPDILFTPDMDVRCAGKVIGIVNE